MARDTSSLLWKILDRSNIITIVSCALFGLYTQSACVAASLAAAVVATLSAKFIKRFVRQPRPTLSGKKTYGMPSSHSTASWFLFTTLLLASLLRPLHKNLPQSRLVRVCGITAMLAWTTVVSLSRIRLGHHTINQVAAGAGYGVLCSVVWIYCWTACLHDFGVKVERIWEELIS